MFVLALATPAAGQVIDTPEAICPAETGFVAGARPFLPFGPVRMEPAMPAVASAPALVYLSDPFGGDAVEVTLERLHGDGTSLDGQYVRVASDKVDAPGTATPGIGGAADFRYQPNDYVTESCFDRVEDCALFDPVNVYYHVDRMASEFWRDRMGVDPDFQADVRTHIAGDGGFADPPRSLIMLSVGWIFMHNAAKEDEIIYHEYTHLIAARLGFELDINSPVEAQAISEGYADYFAASFTDDPRIGEFVVTCPPRQGCLGPPNDKEIRTLATDPAVWNWQGGNPDSGLKYGICTRFHDQDLKCKTSWNNYVPRYTWAIIWGSLLWDLRAELGADVTDRLALEAMRNTDGQAATLERAAGRLIDADRLLFAGVHSAAIEATASDRGIAALTTVAELPDAANLSVFPRPAGVELTLEAEPGAMLTLFDLMGRVVRRERSTGPARWDISGLAPGMYFLRSEGARSETVPVMIAR